MNVIFILITQPELRLESSLLPMLARYKLAPFHLCLAHTRPFSRRLPVLLQRCSPGGSPAGGRHCLRPSLTPEPAAPARDNRHKTPCCHHASHAARAREVPSRNMLIEILPFKLGEVIVVLFLKLVMLTGSQIKGTGGSGSPDAPCDQNRAVPLRLLQPAGYCFSGLWVPQLYLGIRKM